MSVRTTVELPKDLHKALRDRAEKSGTSMRALIVRALEKTYAQPETDTAKKGKRVTGPLIFPKGKLGPAFPTDENPHDLIFP